MTQPDDLRPEEQGQEHGPAPDQGQEKPPFVPSPVSRRIWAWMGVAYVLLAIGLITYWIATTQLLSGITGIMLFPLLGALCAQGINNARLCRRGERGGSFPLLWISAAVMGLLSLAVLAMGVQQLIANWGV